jgi:hypothetical protein
MPCEQPSALETLFPADAKGGDARPPSRARR